MPAPLLSTSQITRAAISFTAVVAAYWLYAMLAVPLIEPEAVEREPPAEEDDQRQPVKTPARLAALLQSLYPEPTDWRRRRPKIVETAQVVLLLKDYRTLDDGRMEIKPCTLLFIDEAKSRREDGHPGRVVVLDAPQGAILQFDNDLDLQRAEFGKLVGGLLVGDVTIRSNESEPGADDRIYLATKNVKMDERRVWTPSDVEFRFGRSYGRGRDLIMTFLPAAEVGGNPRGPNIGGLKSVELVHLDRLHLVSSSPVFSQGKAVSGSRAVSDDPRASPPASQPHQRGQRQMPDGGNSPLEITCEGPFLFDLAGGVATFEDQVDVLRLNPDGPSDQLNCRLLEIHFDGLTPIGRGRVAKEAISASKVSKIVALGFPVVLQSPSLGAQARGERLVYDLAQRQFRLDGEQPVMLEHQGRRIEALAVQYQVPEQGRFGRAWAQGPGNFRASLSPDQSGQPPRVVTASWQDELRLRRDGANHVLSLAGEARVGDGQFGSLAAGEIHLWLKDVADANQVAEDNASEARNILPDRLLAEHAVQLESPALTGSTDRFEVWFQHVPPHALAQSEPPDDEQDPLRPRRQQDPRRPASQFDVSGKVLRVLLATAGKDVQLRDVSVEGDARIVETKTAQPGNEPVRIAGDFVHLSAADSPQAKAVVAGKPALVSGRGVTLKGASVHLDRAANRVWIPGDGEATLPLSGALGGPPSSSAQAGMRRFPPRRAIYRPGATTVSSLRRPRRAPQPRAALRPATAHEAAASAGQQTATVTWQEGMQFDGSTVQLRGGVIARTQQQRLAAPMVDISLTKSLDFSEPPRATAIDVQEIRLRGQVTMENRTIEQGELVSVDEMMVRDLTIDQQTGDLSADGPGWIKTVRRGGDLGPSPFTGPAVGNTNMPQDEAAEDGSDDGLTYLRVTFQTAMTGNVHQRHVELHESVRAVYGKVAQWTDTIDPDLALETEEDVVLLTSDTLQVAEMNPPAGAGESEQSPQQSRRKLGPVELQALGNAMVEGRTFTARAHRIAYAQAKDLLVMEGDGRTDAELYRQSHVGGQTGRAAARKILYWPSTGRMDVDTFSSLNWAGPAATSPGGENPLPGGVRDYLQRERESRPQRTSAPPR